MPKHTEFWFRYHIDFLGIDEIYLYDLDGSFKDLSIVRELQERGKLFYENFITSVPPLKEVFTLAGYKTWTTHLAQTLVQQHCWQRARQNADWAQTSVDLFLTDGNLILQNQVEDFVVICVILR